MGYQQIASGFAAFVTLTSVVTIAPIVAAQTNQLNEWQFDPVANQLKVTLPEGSKPRYFLMAQPARIVLELPNTQLGTAKTQQTYSGAVREIRVSQFQPGLTRFVLELAPQAKLAPGQVQLEQIGGNSKTGKQWALRPLLANAAAQNPNSETTAASVSPTIAKVVTLAEPDRPPAPAQNPVPQVSPPTSEIPPTNEQAEEAQAALPSVLPSSISTPLPPDQPSVSAPAAAAKPAPTEPATKIEPITPPNTAAAPASAMAPLVVTVPAPDTLPSASNPISPDSARVEGSKPEATSAKPVPLETGSDTTTPAAAKPLQLSQANPSLDLPTALPPATFPGGASPSVTVPPLSPASPSAPPDSPSGSTPLPPTAFPTPTPGTVSVPPLQRNSGEVAPAGTSLERPPIRQATPANSAEPSVIEFGQPLPGRSRSSTVPNYAYNASPNVLLPAGSFLDLSYSGDSPLKISGESKQEVLVLQTEIRDWQGNLIAPIGTAVIGRFESSISGNRFVAQAIALGTRNLPVAAESGSLGGNRQVSQNRLLLNSGIGALAGAIIGGFSGLDAVGGAAAGAAVTYVTTPKNATIQPGQMLQVRLTEDLKLE